MHIAVIIANRNYADYVEEAIWSAAEQDYPDKSIWIMDDASIDHSWSVIKNMPGDLSVYQSETQVGQATCRNRLVRLAWDRADAFAFLDSDDRYVDDFSLDGFVDTIREGAGLAYSDSISHDDRTELALPLLRPPFSESSLRDSDYIGGNFVVSKKAFESVGGFDESFRVAECYSLASKLCRKHSIVHVADTLLFTRITNRSLRVATPARDWSYNVARVRNAK